MAAAAKLPPEFALKLQSGLLSFDEYHAAFGQIESDFMADPEHKLEGWDGRMVQEWRLSPTSNDWHTADELLAMGKEDPDGARAIAVVIGRDAALRRVRPMSRAEAYRAGIKSGEIIKVDDWYAPHFFDIEKDAIELTVRRNGLMGFRNELLYGRDEMLYRASVRNRAGWEQSISPDQKVMALYNPMMPGKIWLIDKGDGHTLGTCRLYNRAPAYDQHAIKVAMGEQAADLAAKVLPVRGRHQAEAEQRAARMAANLRVIKEAEAAKIAGPRSDGEGYSLEDLAGADEAAVSYAAADCAESDSYSLDELNAV